MQKNVLSFAKCYLYFSHSKHTNAKRWYNTLARHSQQFTLHTHTQPYISFSQAHDVPRSQFPTRARVFCFWLIRGCIIVIIIIAINNNAAFCTVFRSQIYDCIWISLISTFRYFYFYFYVQFILWMQLLHEPRGSTPNILLRLIFFLALFILLILSFSLLFSLSFV